MITILCTGSRGDFQPYIALAQELQKLGKQVRITGTRAYESFIRSYGIDFYAIQADLESLRVDKNMLKQAGSADNPVKMLLAFNKMKKYGIQMADECYAACQGSELIIYHPGMTLGYFAAQKLGIPAVLASPFPMHETRERPSVIRYGRSKSSPLRNKLSYKLLQGMLWLASKDSVKGYFKKEFGQLPANFGMPYERHTDRRQPAVIACSNYIFPKPSDWNEHVHQHGYWFAEELEAYKPTAELSQFLSAGEKPVYFGFGSVFQEDEKEWLSGLIAEALKKSGHRGLISGMGKLERLPEHVMAIDSAPHTWLFRHVSAVCHHGGAGTTAAGFRAGVPGIIVPFANDQFAWAHRAYDLGLGAKPIYRKQLNADLLAEAIRYVHRPEIISNAERMAVHIASESGARACAKIIVESLQG